MGDARLNLMTVFMFKTKYLGLLIRSYGEQAFVAELKLFDIEISLAKLEINIFNKITVIGYFEFYVLSGWCRYPAQNLKLFNMPPRFEIYYKIILI